MPWKKRTSKASSRIPQEWLNTDLQQGLSSSEAESRLQRVGPNELVSAKENQFKKVLGYFRGPILYGSSHTSLPSIKPKLKSR
jgi:H+-transporting ATPase